MKSLTLFPSKDTHQIVNFFRVTEVFKRCLTLIAFLWVLIINVVSDIAKYWHEWSAININIKGGNSAIQQTFGGVIGYKRGEYYSIVSFQWGKIHYRHVVKYPVRKTASPSLEGVGAIAREKGQYTKLLPWILTIAFPCNCIHRKSITTLNSLSSETKKRGYNGI